MDDGCVLVGTDFSAGSTAALAEARRLAARLHCTVRVMHVVESVPAADWSPCDQARGWLREVELEETGLDVRFGSPWIELARGADACSPAFLVVGSHGASGYQPVSMGTTAQRLSLNARHPVLLVGARHTSPRRRTAALSR